MREIEFRGKCKEDGEWIEGNLIINHNYCNNTIESCSIFSMDIIDDNGSYCGYDFVEIDPETIGQYTGLKDKNGTKIFEGDIVKDILGQIGQIVYKEKYSAFVVDKWEVGYALWFDKGIEVIGNIYDNPELIGEEV